MRKAPARPRLGANTTHRTASTSPRTIDAVADVDLEDAAAAEAVAAEALASTAVVEDMAITMHLEAMPSATDEGEDLVVGVDVVATATAPCQCHSNTTLLTMRRP